MKQSSHAPAAGAKAWPQPWNPIAALLCLMLAIWILLSATVNGGRPHGFILPIGLAVTVFVTASRVSRRTRHVVPAIVVVAAALFLLVKVDTIRATGLRAPLGYSNAAGSFYLIAATGAVLWFFTAKSAGTRAGSAAAALLFGAVPFLNRTRTAAVLLTLLPVAAYLASKRRARTVVVLMAALLAMALSLVVVIGLTYDAAAERTGTLDRLIDASLSERRAALWHDALALMRDHPLLGVGPLNFPEHSPTAQLDDDTRWPHDEFLHVGAEAGLPALLLLLAVLACGFAAVWNARDQCTAAIGAFALGAVCIHATVDYVLHFTPVTVMAAAVVAASVGCGQRPTRRMPMRRTERHPHVGA